MSVKDTTVPVELTQAEIEDILMACEGYQDEFLCTGPGFPEGTAAYDRLAAIKIKLAAFVERKL